MDVLKMVSKYLSKRVPSLFKEAEATPFDQQSHALPFGVLVHTSHDDGSP